MQIWHLNLFYCVFWPRKMEASKHDSPGLPMQTYKRFTYRKTLPLPLYLQSMAFTWQWHILKPLSVQHSSISFVLWVPRANSMMCWFATCAWRVQMPQHWWFSGQRGCVRRDWETDKGRVWERCWSVAQETRVTRVTSCLCSFSLCWRGREKREERGKDGGWGGQKERHGNNITKMGSGSCPSCLDISE